MQCTLITISYNFFTIKNSTIKNRSVHSPYDFFLHRQRKARLLKAVEL